MSINGVCLRETKKSFERRWIKNLTRKSFLLPEQVPLSRLVIYRSYEIFGHYLTSLRMLPSTR